MQPFASTPVTPLLKRWPLVVGLGVAMVIVGVLLVANPFEAARTLALLVAVGLLLSGVDELAQAERHSIAWPARVLGAIWIVTAVVAAAWPGVTLLAVAVIVAIGLILGGLSQVAFAVAYRRQLPMWGIWILDGAASVLLGIVAWAWPGATIVVLGVVLGLWVVLRGLATVTFGLSLRVIHRTTQRVLR